MSIQPLSLPSPLTRLRRAFFEPKVVSDDEAEWLNNCFTWVVHHFGGAIFDGGTPLVLPNDQFFPRQVNNPHAMAEYVFQRVVELCGVAAWPWYLHHESRLPELAAPPLLNLDVTQRTPSIETSGKALTAVVAKEPYEFLHVTYSPEQVAKPQDLVASFAHAVAQHMLFQARIEPPGGVGLFIPAAEVLASAMGFGVMVTNSAYTFRGSCARCYNPRANRQASLSESENVYLLALFAQLQGIDAAVVTLHLKKYLRSSFKAAQKQIARQNQNQLPAIPTF